MNRYGELIIGKGGVVNKECTNYAPKEKDDFQRGRRMRCFSHGVAHSVVTRQFGSQSQIGMLFESLPIVHFRSLARLISVSDSIVEGPRLGSIRAARPLREQLIDFPRPRLSSTQQRTNFFQLLEAFIPLLKHLTIIIEYLSINLKHASQEDRRRCGQAKGFLCHSLISGQYTAIAPLYLNSVKILLFFK